MYKRCSRIPKRDNAEYDDCFNTWLNAQQSDRSLGHGSGDVFPSAMAGPAKNRIVD